MVQKNCTGELYESAISISQNVTHTLFRQSDDFTWRARLTFADHVDSTYLELIRLRRPQTRHSVRRRSRRNISDVTLPGRTCLRTRCS